MWCACVLVSVLASLVGRSKEQQIEHNDQETLQQFHVLPEWVPFSLNVSPIFFGCWWYICSCLTYVPLCSLSREAVNYLTRAPLGTPQRCIYTAKWAAVKAHRSIISCCAFHALSCGCCICSRLTSPSAPFSREADNYLTRAPLGTPQRCIYTAKWAAVKAHCVVY